MIRGLSIGKLKLNLFFIMLLNMVRYYRSKRLKLQVYNEEEGPGALFV